MTPKQAAPVATGAFYGREGNGDAKLLTTVVHVASAALSLSVASDILAHQGTRLFAWHPVFMAIGFLGLMSQGVLLGHGFRRLEGAARVQAILKHAAVQTVACVFIALGFGSIYQHKINIEKPHFATLHGALGATATAGALLATAVGALAFRRFGLLARLPAALQPLVKAAHRAAGPLVWLLGLANAALGLLQPAAGPRVEVHYAQIALMGVLALAQGSLLIQGHGAAEGEGGGEEEEAGAKMV